MIAYSSESIDHFFGQYNFWLYSCSLICDHLFGQLFRPHCLVGKSYLLSVKYTFLTCDFWRLSHFRGKQTFLNNFWQYTWSKPYCFLVVFSRCEIRLISKYIYTQLFSDFKNNVSLIEFVFAKQTYKCTKTDNNLCHKEREGD